MKEMTTVNTTELLTVLERRLTHLINRVSSEGSSNCELEIEDLAVLRMIQSVFYTNFDPFDIYDMEVTGNDTEGNDC